MLRDSGHLSAADAADEQTSKRLKAALRREHPEAFDERGRRRTRALARALVERFGSTRLTGEQVDEVIQAGRRARDAP